MKKLTDLTSYTSVLPYSSEIFGVYQPLLGWRSKRMQERIQLGWTVDRHRLFNYVSHKLDGSFALSIDDRQKLEVPSIAAAVLNPNAVNRPTTFVMDSIASMVPPLEQYSDSIWDRLIDPAHLSHVLSGVAVPQCIQWYETRATKIQTAGRHDQALGVSMVADQLNRESVVAGFLLFLKTNKHYTQLKHLFYQQDKFLSFVLSLLSFSDPMDSIDPFKDLDRVSLSPLGVVHLFRQYFYELDTFLGPPVSHVWLSPGGTVELTEVSTRRTLTERTTEQSIETVVKTEKSITEQDELSDAIKESNRSDTKFGFTTTANQGWIGGSASASASINMDETQEKARETTHKQMRQQTEKLSTEIRKNFKSTFKTISETTDTSSKRYVLSNTTDELINYELRRKMRQVGVQVQDIGTYLCWQTYVDDPGRELGISQLVHLSKDPNIGDIPKPEAPPALGLITTKKDVDIPFVQKSEDRGDLDEEYKHGKEADTDANEGEVERIQWKFGVEIFCDQPGYQFRDIAVDTRGQDISISHSDPDKDTPGKMSCTLYVDHVNFHGHTPIRVQVTVTWEPTEAALAEVNNQYQAKIAEYNERTKYEFQKAFVEAARDRINKASNIEPRRFDDLREEERIVVYRRLIQNMLMKDLDLPDDRSRHVVSELLNSIFDIDKMLYFVAPEWWRPRLHHSHQALGGVTLPPALNGSSPPSSVYGQIKFNPGLITGPPLEPDDQIAAVNTVSWGGTGEGREDNYYITEESLPAKLGSSLGWLLQLDGDNMRNAFLNAPWVKAVIPVRPGKERAAMNWLQRLHVEGTDGLGDAYVAPPEELAQIPHSGSTVTVNDAINHLCDQVSQKHRESMTVGKFPVQEVNDDNKVTAIPIDSVYEHGFYPLQGGFKLRPQDPFEVFDQWLEILPTDQVVPVEVKYSPVTGRQIPVE